VKPLCGIIGGYMFLPTSRQAAGRGEGNLAFGEGRRHSPDGPMKEHSTYTAAGPLDR
jgi:hypothetical protein